MRFAPLTVALCLGASLFEGCNKEEPQRSTQAPKPTATPQPVGRDSIQQALNALAEAMPADLQVGSGDNALVVRRHWRGNDTLQKKFGPGWGDDNVVHLVQFDRDALLIYRGGAGWRLAHRDGNIFKTARAEQIERNPNGWVYRSIDKARFEFDEAGRLRKETTASGAVRNYSYNSAGRLEGVSDTQNQSIQYKYDPAGLVTSVEGPNNQRATYRYESGKLTEATNPTGHSRSYSYQYDAAGAMIAQVRIIGAAPAASAEAQTIAVGVETVVAPVTSTATSAALSNLIRATGVIGTSALTAIAVTYAGIEAKGWVEAKSEASAAQASAKSLKSALENKLVEVLRNDPTKLLPFPDGRKPDPKNPDDIEQLLIQLHSNLTKEKKPFEGIVVTSPDPSELEAALARARQIIGQTRQARGNAVAGMQRAIELDAEAAAQVKNVATEWNAIVRPGALDEFRQSFESVKTGIGQAQAALPQLIALGAELRSAIARCEQAASEACAAAAAAPGSAAEATAQREKFASSIQQATAQVAAQKEKIEQADLTAGETLREQLAVLVTKASQVSAAVGIARSKEWLEATENVSKLATERDRVAAEGKSTWEIVQANKKELNTILASFRTTPQAIALISEMEGLADNLLDNDAELLPAGSYLKMLQAIQDQARQGETAINAANVDALSADATAAIEQLTKARDALVALTADTRGDQALVQANSCLAQIQAVAAASPSTAPSINPLSLASDEAIVPDLSAFQSITEMKAVLAHAELKPQLIAAKENPPSKDKEFKVAGQSPAGNTVVKKGSTVTVSIYQKFEDTGTMAGDADDIVGHWVGTMSFRKWTDPLAFDIQRQGNGYVLTSKATGSKAVPATYAGGKLTSVSQGAVKSAGLTAAVSVHLDLTREGETLSGTLFLKAANGEEGKPWRVVLTRQSK